VLGRNRDTASTTGHTAEGYTEFFAHRVDKIRADKAAALPSDVADTAPVPLSSFQLCSEADIHRIIVIASKILLSSITESMSFTGQQKAHTIVLPLLKKSAFIKK